MGNTGTTNDTTTNYTLVSNILTIAARIAETGLARTLFDMIDGAMFVAKAEDGLVFADAFAAAGNAGALSWNATHSNAHRAEALRTAARRMAAMAAITALD
jgi:hypothetical protein